MTKLTLAEVEQAFSDFVTKENFPCLGARGALAKKGVSIGVFASLGEASETPSLALQLREFANSRQSDDKPFTSFVAVFPETPPVTELEFDDLLWQQLQQLGALDTAESTHANTSDDPSDPHFSFRFGSSAYFVVGLCPSSSRFARRFDWPALVFNPHEMFDKLKAEGKYEGLKNAIREREVALQGSLNPNLADFGEVSEARQYSGRVHPPDWQCPYHREA